MDKGGGEEEGGGGRKLVRCRRFRKLERKGEKVGEMGKDGKMKVK
jgi:hypothetical protein